VKEELLDRTVWRTGLVRGCGHVRQIRNQYVILSVLFVKYDYRVLAT